MMQLINLPVAANDFQKCVKTYLKSKDCPNKGNTAYIKKKIKAEEKHPATKPSVIEISCFRFTR